MEKDRQSPIRARGLSAGRRGILWMLLASLMFTSINACGKYLSLDYDVVQVIWARYVFHMVILALYLRTRFPAALVTSRPRMQGLRSLMTMIATSLILVSVHLMPLAEVSAILFLAPLFVTALSSPLLGERVGPRRWGGVAVGFAGALLIIRPGIEVVQLAILVPFAGAAMMALYQIATRIMGRTDSALTSVVYTPVAGTLVFSTAVPFFWGTPDVEGWLVMLLIGAFGAAAQACQIKALHAARAATVVPILYVNLIWATFFGFVLFANLPDIWTVLGAGVITASGLYIFRRESASRDAIAGEGRRRS